VIDVFMADGNVAVNGVYGPVSVNVGSGNITLDNVSNSTEVRTTNGLVTTVSHEADPFE
jgi:DUF4097 and DUF4098 domain-containing protein YvlB